jgi:hypothetical protein
MKKEGSAISGKRMPRWPLGLIGAPAAVAVWSGWVGLGQLCGFGVIHPLPGIWDAARINTAITLPIGVEAYGAYALGAWLTPGTSERARRFARWSAIGALALGMLGQVAYHLLAAVHATSAPWPVTMLVSCLPVIALALGTALAHLLREPGEDAAEAETTTTRESRSGTVAVPAQAAPNAPVDALETVADGMPRIVPAAVPAGVPVAEQTDVPEFVPVGVRGDGIPSVPARPVRAAAPARAPKRARIASVKTPERVFAAEMEAGELPSLRAIKAKMQCGTDRARVIRGHLASVVQTEAAREAA